MLIAAGLCPAAIFHVIDSSHSGRNAASGGDDQGRAIRVIIGVKWFRLFKTIECQTSERVRHEDRE